MEPIYWWVGGGEGRAERAGLRVIMVVSAGKNEDQQQPMKEERGKRNKELGGGNIYTSTNKSPISQLPHPPLVFGKFYSSSLLVCPFCSKNPLYAISKEPTNTRSQTIPPFFSITPKSRREERMNRYLCISYLRSSLF